MPVNELAPVLAKPKKANPGVSYSHIHKERDYRVFIPAQASGLFTSTLFASVLVVFLVFSRQAPPELRRLAGLTRDTCAGGLVGQLLC